MMYRTAPVTEVGLDGRRGYVCSSTLGRWSCYASSWPAAERAHAKLCATCQPQIAAEREVRKLTRRFHALVASGLTDDEARAKLEP